MKPVNRLAGLLPAHQPETSAQPETETALEKANKLCDSDLLEFAMDLDADMRLRLAARQARQARWAKQLRASAAVLECMAAES